MSIRSRACTCTADVTRLQLCLAAAERRLSAVDTAAASKKHPYDANGDGKMSMDELYVMFNDACAVDSAGSDVSTSATLMYR